MSNFTFGVVGTGFIAGVVADAIVKSPATVLGAVSSRSLAKAQAFVAERSGADAVEGVEALIARADIDGVYIATPTSVKEEVALQAIAAGKHVLVDKPLASEESVTRMAKAAADQGVLFMDATHFVHHPRTTNLKTSIPELIGTPKSLHTAFYFPFDDKANIRFDGSQEPMGAIGDMAWYSMRAVVEYLAPKGDLTTVSVVPERDAETGAVIRASGLIGFASGETSTFDIGYTAGTAIMELSLLGTSGLITMDDFVLDWTNSFPFHYPELKTGFVHRTGMAARDAFHYVETPSEVPGEQLMVAHFAEATKASGQTGWADASLTTQRYLDAVFAAAG